MRRPARPPAGPDARFDSSTVRPEVGGVIPATSQSGSRALRTGSAGTVLACPVRVRGGPRTPSEQHFCPQNGRVEVAGIEPASLSPSAELLRAQPVWDLGPSAATGRRWRAPVN